MVNAICENILRPDTLEDLADAIAAAQQADVNQPDPERAMLEQNLADVHRKINNIIESIENGTASSRLSVRLADLEQQESTLNYQLESLKEVHPPVLDRERILFLLEQFLISPNERTEDYNRRIIDTFVNRIEITDTEMLILIFPKRLLPKSKKIPSRTIVRLGIIWSACHAANSRWPSSLFQQARMAG